MARTVARIAFMLSVLMIGGGAIPDRISAQAPPLHETWRWYPTQTYRPWYRWPPPRVAARFDYNPYFRRAPVYAPARKPFAGIDRFRSRRFRRYGFDPSASLVDELADEYRYYGFDYYAEDLSHR